MHSDSMGYEPQRKPRYEDLTVRGLRHRVTWWGEPAESPIVLLHGFMDCGATWQFLADSLPRSWSLAAPDWRGFGHSDWAPGGYWFPDYFADLEALLDALTPRTPARVIGHSMGANIAQVYGGIRPKRLAWLVNLEGLGLPPSSPQDAPGRFEQWLDEIREPVTERRYRSVSELALRLRTRNPRLPPDRAEFVARAWTRSVGSQRAVADDEVELLFDPRHRHVNPILYRRDEAQACWARVEAPVLLLTAEVSERSAKSCANPEQIRRHIRNLRSVALAGLGHMMHHEDPAAVAKHIVEFEADLAVGRR